MRLLCRKGGVLFCGGGLFAIEVAGMIQSPNILYEDKDILVCKKEAGMAVQSASIGQPDMESMLKKYLALKSRERIPYLGIVQRLDQPVEGILVFAKNKKAAADLSKQMSDGSVHKQYKAVVSAPLVPGEKKELTDYLKKEKNLAVVTGQGDQKAKLSRLFYEVAAVKENRSLLTVELYTGRFHQIRCQLAHAGMPIVGDVRYGGERQTGRSIALACVSLSFKHPTDHRSMAFSEPPENPCFYGFSGEV